MGKNTVQVKQWLDKCYLDSALSETMVKRWCIDFKLCRTDTNDAERSGCPNSAVVQENTKKLQTHFGNFKLKLHKIVEELKISEGSVYIILHEHLSMRKLCSKWVSHLFTVHQKQQCINNSERCLQLFQCNKNEFFVQICDSGWNIDPPLPSRVKSAVSWVDSSRWKLSKVTKDTNISRQGFGLSILGCARYFVHWLSWEKKNHQ